MITDEGKDLNKFQYLVKMAGKSLCRSIYTYIENNEASNRPYTIQDIRSYMERGFNILKKKHPMLPDDLLDKCIQYVVKKMDKEYKIFFLKGGMNESMIKRIVKAVGKHVIAQQTLSSRCKSIRIKESAQFGIVITGL